MSKHVKTGDSAEVTRLEVTKRGCKVVLGDVLDSEIQQYIQRLHVRSHPELIVNGFKEAGTVDVIEKGEVTLPLQDRRLANPASAEEADPFQDIDSD